MYAFDYQRPKSLEEARKALEGLEDSKPLAGGMSIVPVMRHRLANPSALIDLSKIDALKGIAEADGRLRIGAMTSHHTVSKSELVKTKVPALVQWPAASVIRWSGTSRGV
jgi:aerobic carbon-monoxide dehydrogenase medium subunit